METNIKEQSHTQASVEQNQLSADPETKHQNIVAAGGFLGALAMSSCCIVPLVLFSLGVGGAWIGNLTALAPYQPIFLVITTLFLGYGYYLVYRKPKTDCVESEACARPLPNRMVKASLWIATALALAAMAFPYLAPVLLGI